MSRYIDADKALEIWKDQDYIKLSSQENKARIMLDAVPSADVVEVVRCKDCMWWTKQEDSLQGRCTLMQSCPTGAWYCMNGERKNNE